MECLAVSEPGCLTFNVSLIQSRPISSHLTHLERVSRQGPEPVVGEVDHAKAGQACELAELKALKLQQRWLNIYTSIDGQEGEG